MSEFDQDPGAEEGVRVTDKRRIDPETGQVREPVAGVAPEPSPEPSAEETPGAGDQEIDPVLAHASGKWKTIGLSISARRLL